MAPLGWRSPRRTQSSLYFEIRKDPQVTSHQGTVKGLGPFWRQTARGARDRKCHPARANRRRAAPRMRARLSAAAKGYLQGKQPPPPPTPCHFPLTPDPSSRTPPQHLPPTDIIGQRDGPGSQRGHPGRGGAGRHLGNCSRDRGGRGSPGFSRGNQRGGAASRGGAYHLGPGVGEGGTYHRDRGHTMCRQMERSGSCTGAAHARDRRTPPYGAVGSSKLRCLLGALLERFIHSFFLACWG